MRLSDLLSFSFAALWEQKVRTLLTLAGVFLGSFTLIASLSVGRGVHDLAEQEFSRHQELRSIEVWPSYRVREEDIPEAELQVKGDMDDARRDRLRRALVQKWTREHGVSGVPLDSGKIRAIQVIEHVESVTPHASFRFRASLDGLAHDTTEPQEVTGEGISPDDEGVQRRLVAGRTFSSAAAQEILVNEYVLYRWGLANDEDMQQALGKSITLVLEERDLDVPRLWLSPGRPGGGQTSDTLRTALDRLPEELDKTDLHPDEKEALRKAIAGLARHKSPDGKRVFSGQFKICGILREFTPGEQRPRVAGLGQFDVLLPQRSAEAIFGEVAAAQPASYDSLTLQVDSKDNVKLVTKQLPALDVQFYSLAEIAESVTWNITLITFATGFVATVTLVVAALGITNIMFMSVLERRRQIGIMKAVGATDGHVRWIFLQEGTVIGLAGGLLGLLGAWLASFPGNAMARNMIEEQTRQTLDSSVFVFPAWLVVGVPLLAALITTLAAVYPAHRAARIDPIAALRHE